MFQCKQYHAHPGFNPYNRRKTPVLDIAVIKIEGSLDCSEYNNGVLSPCLPEVNSKCATAIGLGLIKPRPARLPKSSWKRSYIWLSNVAISPKSITSIQGSICAAANPESISLESVVVILVVLFFAERAVNQNVFWVWPVFISSPAFQGILMCSLERETIPNG